MGVTGAVWFVLGTLLLLAVAAAPAVSPAAADMPPRVRGIVTAVDDGGITLREHNGATVTVRTSARTAYAYVVPSSLDAVAVDDFVGTAVKGPKHALTAVELAIIPEDMRAGRISYYGWDPLPDPTAGRAGGTATTHMINGLVSGAAAAPPRLTDTSMTNGTVSAETAGAAGRVLTVTYDGGARSFRITVPPEAPVVRYALADPAALTVGAVVMIKVNPGDQADLVTIGRGVAPPM